jgi:hypothetical protein
VINDKTKLPARVGQKAKGLPKSLSETAGLPKYHIISGRPVFLLPRHEGLGKEVQNETAQKVHL